MEDSGWLMNRGERSREGLLICVRWLLAAVLSLVMTGSWAGLSVYTTWSTLPPTMAANQRTITFTTAAPNVATLASEQSAGKITYTESVGAATGCVFFICSGSAGSISYTSSSSLTGFSGNVASLSSGTTSNSTSVTINFTKPTPYVGFLWGVQFNAQNTMLVNLTLENNAVVTLQNCGNASNNLCVAKYVESNWFTNVYNALLGWILGDAVTYHPVYMQYEPDDGKKIKSMQVLVKNCAGCGFLSSNTSQDLKFDYITYVDASEAPHHLELTATSAATTVNATTDFKVTACGNAACTVKYTSGVAGNLTITGVSATSTNIAFDIPAGPANWTTVSTVMTSAGTATIALPTITPTPSNTPRVFCGMGVSAASGNSCNVQVASAAPHHLELTTTTSSTLTCQPVMFTVKACGDSTCSTLYTSGLNGTVGLAGSSAAFTISPASSSTTVSFYPRDAGTALAGITGTSVALSDGTYCGIGGGAAKKTNSCAIEVTKVGFVLGVADHFSEASPAPAMTVQALSATPNDPRKCSPTFHDGADRTVTFKCSYSNPSSGTLPVRIGGQALNAAGNAAAACDALGKAVSLKFVGTSGVATTTFNYADAGQVSLSASYTGGGSEPGLEINGATSVIVAPASFAVVATLSSPPVKAGAEFSAVVTARNSLGNLTPNFGRETAPATAGLSFVQTDPSGGPNAGVLTGSLGQFLVHAADNDNVRKAKATDLAWSEVGRGNLVAALAGGNYLGSGTSLVTKGSTSVGDFVPDKFQLAAAPSCGSFLFNEQPFTVKVTAYNTKGVITQNYAGTLGWAKKTKLVLSGATGKGALSPASSASIDPSSFVNGVASVSTAVKFLSKQTAPLTIGLQAEEDVASNAVKSGTSDVSLGVRSGRLKIFNAFAAGQQDIDMSVQSQYWTGQAWALNVLDSCSKLPDASVVLTGYRDSKGVATTAWTTTAKVKPIAASPSPIPIKNGKGTITFSKPSPDKQTGSVDVALNLGDPNAVDNSCLSTHGGNGTGQPWLRSQNGNCSAAFDRDPSARVTFGIYTPESSKTVHVREVY